MKTTGDRMEELMDEIDYHVLWFKWFNTYPRNTEIARFNNMNKKQQIKFLKTEERKKWKR